ncbi:2-oxoglutarate dehydrogenase E1 component [Photobacterium damselae subsp. piscicida]|uniref:2-oxoglutarate dehydrogenase E1 component n=1 Tax=Photobacterium damsela subsp. piscicida TaxID=38294 RepID=L7NK46_PHODP|nr:2-oxoglutarate dehydrogenase E1 component [Photobacterium damselae]AEU10104.1 2-oxoglutarate dehydrogenase E1 component [Photobacterium damselae subsp. piscicida]MBE8129687.1 2-oxoglutarate dehydrogenase E1 component [Photobacterium damselae subsp. piscicida]PSV80590.1 2-oxoglutarate dehydrogenase E1 component [Photobacterium damselae]PSW84985.1 2-oxoglutarate dehydrogenase E1 component [Photobacterium damselae]QOD51891.1 2-oxoglutarate dehydrogenase E1 component [Photobacterium damselae su
MQNGVMKAWLESSHLAGANAAYVEDLYELYLSDPELVDEQWRNVFDALPVVNQTTVEQPHSRVRDYFRRLAKETTFLSTTVTDPDEDAKQVKVLQLINAYRFRGHQHANLDPLGLWQQERVPDLAPEFHNLTEEDFDQSFNVGSFAVGQETMKLSEIYEALKQTYCGSIGAEYMHITDTEEKRWIQQRLESVLGHDEFSQDEQKCFLEELTAAEGLERYLGAKFPGAKRFSLEGGDALIPMVKELIRHAGSQGVREVVVGMAHRGRLNMLVNVLGKKPQDLFDEFAGKHGESWGTGDVKYHQGFSADFATLGGDVHLALAFNPSHLEIVNPVVVGSVRARQDRLGDHQGSKVLPITIHGDSAIAGQGVVAETFNMSQARGYRVGGTVRIVVNNQIGFTTSNPHDTRSTEYCTDIAKMVQAPIFHVNADDPEAVAFVTRLAFDFRHEFKRDVVIDLVCYRRHGHNEADEPNATQPLMYQKIKKHPTPRKLYADYLTEQGVFGLDTATELVNEYRDALDRGECVVKEWRPMKLQSVDWAPYLGHDWTTEWNSKVDIKRLTDLGTRLCQYPESHKLHSRVDKLYNDRLAMIAGEKPVDWGMAETLAYATLVDDGRRVRITGQDSGRGTFFHRHSVLHNQNDASIYVPLAHLHDKQGAFEVFDSVLSEESVLAFEYGYATTEPRGLTIWEAQFGDFANGAQVVIDQFISSGEQKWGRMCGLTMLLPHGYEGQGPEHSSARLERYLQLCAEQNMQVMVPSTPAQVYHMLRQQVLRPMRRPLIVMSPKSLLRHPLCISTMDELANGTFQAAIDEVDALDPTQVKRVVFCSGKVYYDLLEQRRKNEQTDVAIIRIEQLYPFPLELVRELLAPYAHVTDYVWCQEEPQNQGAWYCSQHNFYAAIPAAAKLTYAGRPASASPAVGYMSVHLKQQKALVEDALTVEQKEL